MAVRDCPFCVSHFEISLVPTLQELQGGICETPENAGALSPLHAQP